MIENTEIAMTLEKTEYPLNKKGLWNPKKFILISVLFSFLPVAILYSINYGRLNNKRKRNISLIIYSVIFVTVPALGFLLDGFVSDSAFASMVTALSVSIAFHLKNDQMKLYEEHIENGGKKASFMIPVVICLTFTVLILGTFIYTINIPDKYKIIQGDELYYTENISIDEVEKLGKYLEENEIFIDDENIISVKIDKIERDYIFSIVIFEDQKESEEVIEFAKILREYLSLDVFNYHKVIVNLCDDRFNVLNSITN
ncbi:hypothetical protein SH2C18_28760 [Clostridium sediminicola]|uniref:hypothetical protein n=1 Tax=Clostridium sediminicola TaxID=3114879 RepID=UPI0031F1FD8F